MGWNLNEFFFIQNCIDTLQWIPFDSVILWWHSAINLMGTLNGDALCERRIFSKLFHKWIPVWDFQTFWTDSEVIMSLSAPHFGLHNMNLIIWTFHSLCIHFGWTINVRPLMRLPAFDGTELSVIIFDNWFKLNTVLNLMKPFPLDQSWVTLTHSGRQHIIILSVGQAFGLVF